MTTSPGNPTAIRPSAAARDGETLIGLKLCVPRDWPTVLLWPTANRGAGILLARLLRRALEQAGVRIDSVTWAGSLNEALFVVGASPRGETLRVILEELEACFLAPYAELAWLHAAEGCWRPYHPANAKEPFDRHLDEAALDAARRELEALLETAADRQREL